MAAAPLEPPGLGRVKVPDFDNSDLVEKHSLTLIGRVTNPKIQQMWFLISFFSEHWKTSSPAIGADLGQGKFQFQFSTAADMQMVMNNRPYHFAHWMLILQQWEHTVSTTCPSQIPFWIKIQDVLVHLWNEAMLRSIGEDLGVFECNNRPYHFAHWMLILQQWEHTVSTTCPSQIPFWIKIQDVLVHLWNEAMLRSIGEDLGVFECWEITKTHAKMKVQVNGLLPPPKTYTLEFANGDEVLATLNYEKLEKHCIKCGMLDHDESECPELLPVVMESQGLPPLPPNRREGLVQ
ncbi:unnamed protein product [Microthlaspi erraticum]|uniref:DUF4283 domain-containing protein n=1 Tax=Microthlaspi erraticum TaxID=1685480 RepID=A0A6D2I2V0_9BRAS|nr:unnamed protein product [Microthlaspi erraticum]